MSKRFSDLQILRISLFGGAAIGAMLTIVIPGSMKLTFFQFQLMCTILGLLSLLVPKSKEVKSVPQNQNYCKQCIWFDYEFDVDDGFCMKKNSHVSGNDVVCRKGYGIATE